MRNGNASQEICRLPFDKFEFVKNPTICLSLSIWKMGLIIPVVKIKRHKDRRDKIKSLGRHEQDISRRHRPRSTARNESKGSQAISSTKGEIFVHFTHLFSKGPGTGQEGFGEVAGEGQGLGAAGSGPLERDCLPWNPWISGVEQMYPWAAGATGSGYECGISKGISLPASSPSTQPTSTMS